MRFIPLSSKEQVAASCAKMIIDRILKAMPTKEKPYVLGLSIGSIMARTYLRLVEAYERGIVSFEHVVTFNVDEYVGLDKEHPESVYSFMHANFVDFVDINPDNVHILDGNAKDKDLECDQFESLIESKGGIDLLVGVVGNDGHIAYNEPYSSITSRTRHKFLAHETVSCRLGYFDNDFEKVPKEALTFGIGTILDARELIVMACGLAKASAICQAVEGPVNHVWSVGACCQMHKRCSIIVDDEAVTELKVKTLRYFRKTNLDMIDAFASTDRSTSIYDILALNVK